MPEAAKVTTEAAPRRSSAFIILLRQMPEAPWADGGRRLTQRRLAANLRLFGIHVERPGGQEDRRRGYRLADFVDAWDRYLGASA
jgi:hypothetical protein